MQKYLHEQAIQDVTYSVDEANWLVISLSKKLKLAHQYCDLIEDMWYQAMAAAEIAEKTATRMELLYSKGVISEQKRDEAAASAKATKAATSAAKEQNNPAVARAQTEDRQATHFPQFEGTKKRQLSKYAIY